MWRQKEAKQEAHLQTERVERGMQLLGAKEQCRLKKSS
jgi:hypothetical protein